MTRSSLWKLDRLFGRRRGTLAPCVLGILVAVSTVMVILTCGALFELLINISLRRAVGPELKLSPWLVLPTTWINADESPVAGALILIAIALGFAWIGGAMLYWLYRTAGNLAIESEIGIRHHLKASHLAVSSDGGIASQGDRWLTASSTSIAEIRDGLMAHHRNAWRYGAQATLSVLLAAIIHPLLTLLTVIAFVLLWRLYTVVDRHRRRSLSILADRSHSSLEHFNAMMVRGPFLSRIHPASVLDTDVRSQLRALRDAELKKIRSDIWRTPFLAMLICTITALILLVLTVQLSSPKQRVGLAGAVTVLALIAWSYTSVVQLVKGLVRTRIADQLAFRLLRLLEQPSPLVNASTRIASPLAESLELNNVSVSDADGHVLLSQIQSSLRPGLLVAIVASPTKDAMVLAELLLGFGINSSGTIRWDGVDVKDLNDESLNNQRMWIDGKGPLVSGTVIENLVSSSTSRPLAELVEATRAANVYDSISELPETFATLLSTDDDRLKEESLFRLGIARAILKASRLVVGQEPANRNLPEQRAETVRSLRGLAERGMLVVIIAESMHLLREADLVLLLHDQKLVSADSHNRLLETSDLYRHLTYLRFSPFPNVSQ